MAVLIDQLRDLTDVSADAPTANTSPRLSGGTGKYEHAVLATAAELAAHNDDPDAHDLSGITATIDGNRVAAEAALAAEADARVLGDDASAAIATDVLNDLNTHVLRADNPHGVNAVQVGAYTTGQTDSLLAAKANASALANYMPIVGGTMTTGTGGELRFAPASGVGIAQHGDGEANARWSLGGGAVSNGIPSLVLNYNGNTTTAAAAGTAIAATNTRQLSLYTSNGTALTERVRVTSAGRVLLGPSLPTDDNANALQVNGGVKATGFSTAQISVGDVLLLPSMRSSGSSSTMTIQGGSGFNPAAAGTAVSFFSGGNAVTNASGTWIGAQFAPTMNQTATAGTIVVDVNPTVTAWGSGTHKLQRWAVGSVEKASIDKDGNLSAVGKVTVTDLDLATGFESFANVSSTAGVGIRLRSGSGSTYATFSSTSASVAGSLSVATTFNCTNNATVGGLIVGASGANLSSINTQLNIACSNILTATSGSPYGLRIAPTYNQITGTAGNTDLLVNRSGTVGSGTQRLASLQVSSSEKFGVDAAGNTTLTGSLAVGGPITLKTVNVATDQGPAGKFAHAYSVDYGPVWWQSSQWIDAFGNTVP